MRGVKTGFTPILVCSAYFVFNSAGTLDIVCGTLQAKLLTGDLSSGSSLCILLDSKTIAPCQFQREAGKAADKNCYVMLLSILSKDRVVQKDKPVGVLPTKSTYTPEITKTMT